MRQILNFGLFLCVIVMQSFLAYQALTFKENLHCSQYTSLVIATLEMEAHEEEKPAPLIYVNPYAWPLRAFYASTFVLFVLYPLWASMHAFGEQNSLKKRQYLLVLAAFVLHTILAAILAGERFAWINIVAIVNVTASLILLSLFYVIKRQLFGVLERKS